MEHWRLGWKQEGGNKTRGGGMKEGGWGQGCKNHGTVVPVVLRKVLNL